VRDSGSDCEQQHAQGAARDDTDIIVMPIAEAECHEAQRYDDHQHLRVQVAFGKLGEKWQTGHDKRQRQTVYQAQRGQGDCCAIKPLALFRHTMICNEMPLCYQTNGRFMDKRLLTILRCPVTHKGLSLARSATLHAVNTAIKSGNLCNREGRVLDEPLQEALVSDDEKVLYPVRDGIPVLLEGEAVNMEQIG